MTTANKAETSANDHLNHNPKKDGCAMKSPECRWCNGETDAEFVDVGVGMVQVTGAICWDCNAYEMGPYQTDGRITEVEMATMWLGPAEDHAIHSPFNPEQVSTPW